MGVNWSIFLSKELSVLETASGLAIKESRIRMRNGKKAVQGRYGKCSDNRQAISDE
jgi:hypothetical protein